MYKCIKADIDYYTTQGSHVFACFIDYSKAFDSVNYWKLFSKLLDDGEIVLLLIFWHSGIVIRLLLCGGRAQSLHNSVFVMVCVKVVFYHPTCLLGISEI